MKKKIKVNLGDVFQIELPNDKYAYGRVYKDGAVAIYDKLSDRPDNPPIGSDKFMFFVGLYKDILTSGKWPIIAKDIFKNEDEAWPPKEYIRDPISGEYSIYHRGLDRPSTEEECKGLEQAAVWDAHHVIERIIEQNARRYSP